MKMPDDITPLSMIRDAAPTTIGEWLVDAAFIIIPLLFELAAVAFFTLAAGLWSAWSAGLL